MLGWSFNLSCWVLCLVFCLCVFCRVLVLHLVASLSLSRAPVVIRRDVAGAADQYLSVRGMLRCLSSLGARFLSLCLWYWHGARGAVALERFVAGFAALPGVLVMCSGATANGVLELWRLVSSCDGALCLHLAGVSLQLSWLGWVLYFYLYG